MRNRIGDKWQVSLLAMLALLTGCSPAHITEVSVHEGDADVVWEERNCVAWKYRRIPVDRTYSDGTVKHAYIDVIVDRQRVCE